MCTATIYAGTANAIRGGMLAVALSIIVGAYLFKGDCVQAAGLIGSMACSLSPQKCMLQVDKSTLSLNSFLHSSCGACQSFRVHMQRTRCGEPTDLGSTLVRGTAAHVLHADFGSGLICASKPLTGCHSCQHFRNPSALSELLSWSIWLISRD